MKKQIILLAVCIAAIALLVTLFIVNRAKKIPVRRLAYYGKQVNERGDTVYHTVKDFSFTDQEGRTITKADVKDKIYVADYFFTTCGSICPVMKKQMQRVYQHYLSDDEIMFLSHTVDPEHDTVEVMKEFAKGLNARSEKWKFLTGDKKDLYDVARKGYLLDAQEGDGGEEDFIHTQNFALIDRTFHIRGFYDGTDSAEVDRLITDIKVLKQEYEEVK